jgi:dihydrodipicolinate synthase/N-acetylneuraminate lyase
MRGVFPIGQTPVTPSGQLGLDCLQNEVRFCNRYKVHGLAWPQIASGWDTLSEPERLSGAEAILAAGKGRKTALVIGVQDKDGNIDQPVVYARHAARNGADAVISLPPPNSPAGQKSFCRRCRPFPSVCTMPYASRVVTS